MDQSLSTPSPQQKQVFLGKRSRNEVKKKKEKGRQKDNQTKKELEWWAKQGKLKAKKVILML